MSASFDSLMNSMHKAIVEKDAAPAVAAIKPHPRLSAQKQMAIYIEGYRIRLTQAVRSDYPALLELLGEKEFDVLALGFIEKNPSMHFNLDRYPHSFAAYVHAHSSDEFAVEVAALEAAIADAFMGKESAPLDPAALAGLSPEAFGGTVLAPRTASRLMQFSYPVNDWLTAQRENSMPQKPAKADNFLYVYRHDNNVQRAVLSRPAYLLLEQLGRGMAVGEVLEMAADGAPEHIDTIVCNLQPWFSEWIGKGFFQTIQE